ncbi:MULTISPECIES: acyl-CoA dehydrogenase family protein [Caldilinea]|jgi:acyl-CoA dehydrogenase|uniref:Putative acyl-CoA dehydrogenase n=1 Tax=Caldilinea aerophila (strain DSM 14535 / JCM 11387 / NBRC 104270 / STL-6-O1) TaxID=926550 RepID=I0I9L3_CALAS|nr:MULTISPECIES: acyl-CoA dehydrogenase family protein [Caldilinea]MBO9394552.1 acyl-CoA dehydrogenase family protein [Caldilinea sp.]BAM01951.1 putative acyl-CoA dehydrogenase [Caldilinea aerophila DSM 14535 = NBRC 104270]GIV75151.1 MAG: acyl-CoA dehydrogenase [Caldilinea sp.]
MPIEFKLPEVIERQLRDVQVIAEHVMRPDSRYLDEHEHERPWRYIHAIWPRIQEMERANIAAARKRAMKKQEALRAAQTNGHGVAVMEAPPAEEASARESIANLSLIHMIEMLSWGDAGIYLCIPGGALGGAAIQAVGTPEQIERFLTRYTEGEPKWGAMAMTEPQAGSDTSNIQTTATFDPETNEWILNGQKIFCTNGKLALEESNGLVVVWATVDKKAGRAGMKPFVVEAGTPGVVVAKVEEKLGIRASDTATIIFDNARIPADNILGDAEVKTGVGDKGFKGAMKTFDATRPIVAASAIGVGRAAFEFTRDTLAKEGVKMEYGKPRWKLSAVQADLLEMEAQLRAAWLLTLKAAALLDAREENKLESSMAKVKAGRAVTLVTQKAVELLGPLGYSTEFLVEKWMRDAKINDIYEGTGQINTLIVARQILGYTRNELK